METKMHEVVNELHTHTHTHTHTSRCYIHLEKENNNIGNELMNINLVKGGELF